MYGFERQILCVPGESQWGLEMSRAFRLRVSSNVPAAVIPPTVVEEVERGGKKQYPHGISGCRPLSRHTVEQDNELVHLARALR